MFFFFTKNNYYNFYIQVETEELIYPWQSLVAEFGGLLGLFLGFSFMTIWDSVASLQSFKHLFVEGL